MKPYRAFYAFLFIALGVFAVVGQIAPRGGHTGEINGIAFSGDNRFLASVSDDETIKIWDLATGKEVLTIRSDEGEETFKKVAFSSDGKFLVSSSSSNFVQLWDAKTGKKLKEIVEYNLSTVFLPDVNSIVFSPDNKNFAIGGEDFVRVYNITDEEPLEFENATKLAVFNPKGTFLATGGADNSIKIWNVKTGLETRTLKNTEPVESITFNPLGTILAVVTTEDLTESYVELWNVATGLKMKAFPKTKINGFCAWLPDGKSLVVNAATGFANFDFSEPDNLILLSALNGRKQGDLTIESSVVSNRGFSSRDGKMLAVSDSTLLNIHVFDLLKKTETQVLKGHTIKTTSLVFAPDDKSLLAGYDDGTVIWWDITSGKIKKQIVPEKDENESRFSDSDAVTISPDGNYFLTEEKGAKFFSTADGRLLTTNENSFSVAYGAFSPDGKTFAVISSETISLYEVPSGKLLNRFVHNFSEVPFGTYIAFSPDGKTLITALESEIAFWDAAKGTMTKKINDESINAVAFSRDNKYLIIAQKFGELKVLKGDTQKLLYEFKDFQELQEPHFSISPNGEILATVSADNELLELRDLATGKLLRKSRTGYDADNSPVLTTFSHNGSLIAVGGINGIKVFKTATAEEIFSMK